MEPLELAITSMLGNRIHEPVVLQGDRDKGNHHICRPGCSTQYIPPRAFNVERRFGATQQHVPGDDFLCQLDSCINTLFIADVGLEL
jgi:hypothetical protein